MTSLLLQKGAHDIDVIHWLAGGFTSSGGGYRWLGLLRGDKDNDLRCPTCPENKTCTEV